jgi:hypothetical protein
VARRQEAGYAEPAAPPPPAEASAPPPPTAVGPSPDQIEQLKQLAALKDQGVLTDEEFATQKAKTRGSSAQKSGLAAYTSRSKGFRRGLFDAPARFDHGERKLGPESWASRPSNLGSGTTEPVHSRTVRRAKTTARLCCAHLGHTSGLLPGIMWG